MNLKGLKTKHGYAAEELISAMQKLIRRAETEAAATVAMECCLSSEALEDFVWKRLKAICVEDIGMGQPQAAPVIDSLDHFRKDFEYGESDRWMFTVHAVRYLCLCDKNRDSCNLKSLIKRKLENDPQCIELPDFVYDMHTEKGRAMGRGYLHFLDEASKVIPEVQVEENTWKQQLRAMMAEKQEGPHE